MPFILPSTFDRATGVLGLPGTETPAGAIKSNYAGGNIPNASGYVPIFEEYSDSPEIESGEQSTIIHRFSCDYATGQILLINYPRGAILQDSQGFYSRVLSTKLVPIAKTNTIICNFTVTSEAMSFGSPPDEFDVETVELNPSIDKHPRYTDLTYGQRYAVDKAVIVDSPDYAQQYQNLIMQISSSGGTSLQQKEATELFYKKYKQEDSFYLSGYKVTWSQYFWTPQLLNPGGYIEDPVAQGGLPYQFWSTNGLPAGGYNIFSLTSNYNENMFPNFNLLNIPPYGLSWLRQSDTMHLQRTWFRVTRTWIGAPLGNWDNELYNRIVQPYQTDINGGTVLN